MDGGTISTKYLKKTEPVKHIIVFGKQGSGKDLLIVGWLFEEFRKGRKVYSNSPLQFDYIPVESVKDIYNARNGVLYIHDADLLFNSRDFALKHNQDKQETLLELVNNARKHNVSMYMSVHRPKSIDVKLRTLINYWVQPRMVQVGPDKTNLWDYIIVYDVYDEYLQFSHTAVVEDIPLYAVLYDTLDCVRPLKG